MNYKKGLTRIFIIGLFAFPVAGFFSSADQYAEIARDGRDTVSRIKEQIKKEPCASIVKENPKEFPQLNPRYTCSPTYIYWGGIRKWQDENGKAGAIIDDDTVEQAIEANTKQNQSNIRWIQIAFYTIGYLLVWLVGLILFYLGRWIYRGFKSQ